MHASGPPHLDANEPRTLAGIPPRAARILAATGGSLLVLAFVLGLVRGDALRYFLHAYLVAFCFYLSISLGALFFVALQHASRAGWSVCVRRVSEILAANTLVMALLFLPILIPLLLGNVSLYEWLDPEITQDDAVLQGKQWYLNLLFFTLRAIVWLAAWSALVWFFWRRSLEQDESGDAQLTLRMERFSYAALIIFGVTVTFAAFDWIMSLTPHWYSTIFGVYYFSGAVVGFFAAMILVLLALQASGRLRTAVTVEHYHELGKFLFAFIIFWGYIAFSQYMLIWYANIPEETSWYLPRQQGSWTVVSLLLLFGHLLIPFVGLISREVKRRKALLGFWAVWILIFHWLDVYYLIMPQVKSSGMLVGPIDVCCFAGMGCIYLAGAMSFAGQRALIPLKDPRLGESLAFENI
jgi:hypothetical protein